MSPSIKIIYKLQFSELGGAACGHGHLHPRHHASHPGCAHRQLRGHNKYCEAQARVRQGSARDGSQGERPQSFNPCLELTLKLVATHPPPTRSLNSLH